MLRLVDADCFQMKQSLLFWRLHSLFQVKRVEFMESHLCRSSDVFQYLVLLQVQVTGTRGKVAVLDAVDRFRAGNMSGYVTVYSDLTTRAQNTNIVMV